MEQYKEKKAKVDIEGSAGSWWYVCEECHSAVNPREKVCNTCGSRLDWTETRLVIGNNKARCAEGKGDQNERSV